MSHITTFDCEIQVLDEAWMNTALTAMQSQFHGLTFAKMDEDTVMVRYRPIEVYQQEGNMRFIRNHETGEWEMQYDIWECQETVEKVRDAFFEQYQLVGVNAWTESEGYSTETATRTKNKELEVVATGWC
jgi:hypothetical protein